MPRPHTTGDRQAQAILERVRGMVALPDPEPIDPAELARLEKLAEALDRDRRESRALALAVLTDEPVPVSLLKPWASYAAFWKWEKAGKLTLTRANGKVCVRPSHFFALWRSLNNPST